MSLPDIIAKSIENQRIAETNGLGITDKIFYGGAATILSAANSIYNTVGWYGQWAGLDYKPEETADWVKNTIGEDASKYYQENKSAFDTAGFLVGSIGLGIGASAFVKAAQLGKAGATMQRFTGVFSSPRKQLLESAVSEYSKGALAVSSQLSAARTKAFALGLGDNSIHALAAEGLITGALHQSPFFEGWETKDFIWNSVIGIGLGAGIGGTIEHFRAGKFFREVQDARTTAVRPWEPSGDPGKGNYTRGDVASRLIQHLDNLPTIPAGEFETAKEAVKAGTIKSNWLQAKALANEMAGGNAALGAALIDSLQTARAGGAGKVELHQLLSNAERVIGISLDDAIPVERFYFRPPEAGKKIASLSDAISSTPFPGVTPLPYRAVAGKQPSVMFVGTDAASVKQAYAKGADVVFDEKGYPHVRGNSKVILRAPVEGEATIFSRAVEKAREKLGMLPREQIQQNLRLADVIVDLKTGEITETAYATVGDLFSAGRKDVQVKLALNQGKTELYAGLGNKLADEANPGFWNGALLAATDIDDVTKIVVDNIGDSYLSTHARWGLAQMTETKPGSAISMADLPMFVRALRTANTIAEESVDPKAAWNFLSGLKFTNLDGTAVTLRRANVFESLSEELAKVSEHYIDAMLNAGVTVPIHKIQRVLNLPVQAIEDVLAKGQLTAEQAFKHFIQDPIDVLKPSYAKIRYSVGNPVDDATGMLLRGEAAIAEKIKLQQTVNETVFASFSGADAELFPPMSPELVRQAADPTGVQARLLKGFEGDYSLKSLAGYIGNLTEKLKNRLLKERTEKFAFGGANAILNNEKAAAEASSILHGLQRTGKKYIWFDYTDPVTGVRQSGILEEKLDRVRQRLMQNPDRDFAASPFNISELQQTSVFKELEKEGFTLTGEGFRPWRFVEDEEAQTFLKTFHSITGQFANEVNMFRTAQGLSPVLNPNHLYAPPVDLKKTPYVVFIRAKQQQLGGLTSTGAVTARTDKELTAKLAKIDQTKFEIISKKGSREWHEAQGDFEYNMMMNDPDTDSFMRREGMLADYYPSVSAGDMVAHLNDYIAKQTTVLTRNFVSLRYAQEMEELLALSSRHMELATSAARRTTKASELAVSDPYLGYIKTMLNMSSFNEHPNWYAGQEKVNAFLTPAFNKVRQLFFSASQKHISFDEANDLAEQAGLGRVYEKVADGVDMHAEFKAANGSTYDPQIVSRFIAGMNNLTVNLTLRLDHAAGLINAVSTPILAFPEVKSILKHIDDPKITGELGKALSYKVAQTGIDLPTPLKLMHNAIRRLLDPKQGPELAKFYSDIRIVRPDVKDYYNLIDEMSVRGNESMARLGEIYNNSIDRAAKLFLSDFSEQKTRMITADMMKQLTELAGIEDRLAAAYIHTFTSRINGIFQASQRPAIFQGPVGQAMGLFQSYQFNLIQNVFRHLGNRDRKAAGMLLGLQASLFGMQSLPAFQFLNMHLVGNAPGNSEHRDLYSFTPSLVGQEVGEAIMYGGIGFFTDTALYTRGDINPRNITILPLNPAEWPAISAFSKVTKNLVGFADNLMQGADLGNAMKFALEHNGISRPLTGLMQVAQGYSTTSKGGLIQANADIVSMGTVAHLIGSKPLNEAIAMDANYRMVSYRAKDIELRADLSRIIRMKLLSGEDPTSEDWDEFSMRYAKSGGTMEGFNRFTNRIMQTYGTPVANIALTKMNTTYSRRMWEIMGGEGLDDMLDQEALASAGGS